MIKKAIVTAFCSAAAAAILAPSPSHAQTLLCTVSAIVSGNFTSGACGADSLVNGNYDFATGYVSKVTGNNSSAFGAFSFAGGDNAVAIGARATAANASPYNGASNATAVGAYSTAGVGGTATGMGSTASGMDAIAYGHSATADQSLAMAIGFASQAKATNAVAIGANSLVTATGSVALGSGSVADVANTVSIGAAGNERRLVNLANGTVSSTSRDAVNGSQLNTANNLINANSAAITTLNTGLATTNANASTAATRTASALGGGSVADGTNAPTAPSYNLFGTVHNNVGTALGALQTHSVANATNLTNLTTQITSGTIGLVQQANPSGAISVSSSTGGDSVQFGGTSGARRLTGIGTGMLSASSTDAVTGAQLNTTNTNVATNAANVSSNAASLATTNQRIASALGGGSALDGNGVVTAPTYSLFGTTYTNAGSAFGALETRTNANSNAITNLSSQVLSGTSGLVLQDQTTRAISIASTTDGTLVDVSGNAGSRRLTGLSAGSLSATSTDAVTGAQLNSTNANLATTASGLSAANAAIAQTAGNALTTNQRLAGAFGGGSMVDGNGILTAPSYSLFGTTYTNLGGALGAIETQTTGNTSQISSIWSRIGQANLTLLQQDATSNDISLGGQTAGTLVTIAGTTGNRRLTGLSNGAILAGSTDAVTGSQLNDTNAMIGSLSGSLPSLISAVNTIQTNFNTGQQRIAAAFGGGSTIDGNGLATAPSYTILGASYGNVGSALAALNTRVETNSTNVSNLMAGGGGAGGSGMTMQNPSSRVIQVASTTDGTVLDVGGTSGPRLITGVMPGQVSATSVDAVNGAQLNSTNAAITSLANRSANADAALSQDIAAVSGHATTTARTLAAAIGGGVSVDSNGAVSVPQFAVQNSYYSSVSSAVGALDQATTTNSNAVQNLAVSVNNLSERNRFISINGRGNSASSSGAQSIALGSQAVSSGEEAVAIGSSSVASATGAIAVGSSSAATGRNAIAIGVNSLATGSVALGVNTRASNGGAALGDDSIATGADSAALGPKSVATAANSVAIGSGSVANAPNIVSVGSVGNERRITNVATGIERTDAANVGQIQDYQSNVSHQLNEFNQRISNVTGGVAMAMAMSGGSLPDNKAVGFALNVGAFGGQTAIGISQYLRVNSNIVLSAGMGIQQNQVGGRAGMMMAW